MNGAQTVAAAAGASLVGVNFWTGPQRKAFTRGALSSSASPAQEESAHKALVQLAGELVFVGVAVLIAGGSSKAGGIAVAVFAALWILWLIKHYSKGTK